MKSDKGKKASAAILIFVAVSVCAGENMIRVKNVENYAINRKSFTKFV